MAEHKLPDLTYDYKALEPVISAEMMEIHHSKHHASYVANLNKALEQYAEAEAKNDLTAMITLQPAIEFNGGGHINHSIFWTNLAPQSQGGGTPPTGSLAEAIDKDFGSLESLIKKMTEETVAIKGSGWGWLGYTPKTKELQVTTTTNHGLASSKGLVPLLCLDVWEHAYYLKYKNARPEFLKQIWHIINWNNIAKRYETAQKSTKSE